MTLKNYRELLEAVLKMQISYIEEESESEYNEGKITGLYIALEKLKDSAFLTDKEG